MSLTVGSLFSGIGGLELGLERAGMRVLWQVEKDEYCRRVLAKHWPEVERFEDVKDVGAHNLKLVDLICGGFPCQDISYAGKGAGLSGERSGLWYEFARIIREVEPRIVVVENVAALLTRGLDAVLGTLADLGYDAEWDRVSAADVGAPHRRQRIFIVAHSPSLFGTSVIGSQPHRDNARASELAHAHGIGLGRRRVQVERHASDTNQRSTWQGEVADTAGLGCRQGRARRLASGGERPETTRSPATPDASLRRHPPSESEVRAGRDGPQHSDWWSAEPDVGRVANGVPKRVDRLRALGNAVVPQVAEYIGRLIVEADKEMRGAA